MKFKCEGYSWDTAFLSCNVMKKDSMYYMWYTGELKENRLIRYIGFAWSVDGLNWTKLPEPVLKPGSGEEWDAFNVVKPRVLFDGKHYHMWYTGGTNHVPSIRRVGYATSDDGIHWKKYPANPVFDVGEPGSWDDRWVMVDYVNFNGSYYEMWYLGYDFIQGEIGYATSPDGIHWIKYPGNPVIRCGELGTWDSWWVGRSRVLIQDSVYRMWYNGSNYTGNQLGFATTSADEAKAWDTAEIHKPKREIRVQMFNRVEYIKVDSLAQILPELSGSELIDAYNKLALAYSLNNSEKSFYYAEKALELAEKADYPEGKAMALYCKGHCQYVMDNYSDALANQLSALWLFDSLGMLYEIGNLLSQIASIHTYTGSHDLACKYYKQALEVFEEQNATRLMLLTLNFLGYSYLKAGDTTNAINVFQRKLSLAKKTGSIRTKGYAYEALGQSYKGRIKDSSIYYFNEAQKIFDTISFAEEGHILLQTAEAFYSFGPEYYQEAEEYFSKCYEIYRFQGREERVRLCYGMAELYFNTGRYDKTREFLDVSHETCLRFLSKLNHHMYSSLNDKLENDIYLKSYLEKIHRLYYRLDTTLHDEGSALKHFLLATQWKDSIYNEQNRKQIAMLQGKYETETTQNHISMLEKENEVKDLRIQQSRIFMFGMGGFVLMIVLMALLFIRQNKIRTEHKTVILEQKLLRLQMNPHFIFNALSNILNLINRNNNPVASKYLTRFSKLLRNTLEGSRHDSIKLDAEINGLENYLELQKMRFGDKFDFQIDVDDAIDIENTTIPPLLVQPFIENAIEHGIKHKKTKGHVYLRFLAEENQVVCEVEDDGVGREKAWEIEYSKRKDHQSLATTIIKERIQNLNKNLKL